MNLPECYEWIERYWLAHEGKREQSWCAQCKHCVNDMCELALPVVGEGNWPSECLAFVDVFSKKEADGQRRVEDGM